MTGDALVAAIKDKGMIAVIPSRSCRVEPRPLNKHQYKERHLVENCFAKLKQFRRVASRYEKTARNFLACRVIRCHPHLDDVTRACSLDLHDNSALGARRSGHSA
jgi:transposase